jgi:hypothetical protein
MNQFQKIASLNGRFTEASLRSRGIETAAIRKSVGIGLLRSTGTGILETVPPHQRALKLRSLGITETDPAQNQCNWVRQIINGVPVLRRVVAYKGGKYTVSDPTDPHGTPVDVNDKDVAPVSDQDAEEEQKKPQTANAPKGPINPNVPPKPMTEDITQAGFNLDTAQGRFDFLGKVGEVTRKCHSFKSVCNTVARELDVRVQNLPADLQRAIQAEWLRQRR